MEILLTSVTVAVLLLIAFRQIFVNKRMLRSDKTGSCVVPYIMFSTCFNLAVNLLADGQVFVRSPAIMLLGLAVLCIMSFSFVSVEDVLWLLISITAIGILASLLQVLAVIGIMPALSVRWFVAACPFVSLIVSAVFAFGIWMRLRNLKNVMRSGSIWGNVALGVDAVYALLLLMVTLSYIFLFMLFPQCRNAVGGVFSCICLSMMVALGIRSLNESLFVLWTEHERMIVESMRISHADAVQDSSGSMLLYKNLYDKVLEHFNQEKPYLNSSLTINDVVAVVFSNKLYISKAINRFTGRNFCQFVNYHRVIHAVELFRENPKIKIADLASQSGFNSAVSFGTAFNLFMGEKPGDWCRRERRRLEKLKK